MMVKRMFIWPRKTERAGQLQKLGFLADKKKKKKWGRGRGAYKTSQLSFHIWNEGLELWGSFCYHRRASLRMAKQELRSSRISRISLNC